MKSTSDNAPQASSSTIGWNAEPNSTICDMESLESGEYTRMEVPENNPNNSTIGKIIVTNLRTPIATSE